MPGILIHTTYFGMLSRVEPLSALLAAQTFRVPVVAQRLFSLSWKLIIEERKKKCNFSIIIANKTSGSETFKTAHFEVDSAESENLTEKHGLAALVTLPHRLDSFCDRKIPAPNSTQSSPQN